MNVKNNNESTHKKSINLEDEGLEDANEPEEKYLK